MKRARKNKWELPLFIIVGMLLAIKLIDIFPLEKVYSQSLTSKKEQITKNSFSTFLKELAFNKLNKGSVDFDIERPFQADSAMNLSLESVSDLALKNSLDIQIAQYDAYISRVSLKDAESIFDTFLKADVSFNRDRKTQISTFSGTEAINREYSLGIEKKIPTGTKFSLDTSGSKSKTDSVFTSLNPNYEVMAGISLKQELGKNFFGLADRSKIKITKIDIENSEFTSLDRIENILYNAQKAYWNLVLKNEEILIKKDMFREAEKLYKIYQDKYLIGLVEEAELLAMEALLYTRESDVSIAALAKETAKNNLLFLINKGGFDEDVRPEDSLLCSPKTVDLHEALLNAARYRRDYKRVNNELKKNKINIVVKENALWPEIDFEATLTRNNLNSEYNQALEGIGKKDNDEFLFKLSFKIPFENREAKADFEKINLEKKKFLLQLKRVERLILRELNDKVNQVNITRGQVRLYEKTVDIHKRKLDKQVQRLKSGRSSSDVLVRYEEDLLNARLAFVSYLFNYRVSLIELDLVQNTLLDKYWHDPL